MPNTQVRNIFRTAGIALVLTAGGATGAATASATAPVPVLEPGGAIRLDLAPGEWWYCGGVSPQPPFTAAGPEIWHIAQGPNPLYLRFPSGSDVWVSCLGTGLPVVWEVGVKTQ